MKVVSMQQLKENSIFKLSFMSHLLRLSIFLKKHFVNFGLLNVSLILICDLQVRRLLRFLHVYRTYSIILTIFQHVVRTCFIFKYSHI